MKHRVLILAESCNPDWPSLPAVAYKYARALGKAADVHVVTQVRNRPNIETAGTIGVPVTYIDNERVAYPLYRLSQMVRGGREVGWSTNQILNYLPYLEFERLALRRFRSELRNGAFDVVHRITPMSPTLPSYTAGRIRQPFVIGPLNGNLDWPKEYRAELKREREGLRRLRNLYRHLPFAKRTFAEASAILAAFQHTIDDLPSDVHNRIVPFPEIGFDDELFHDKGRRPIFDGPGPYRFLFVGRLVPYKVPEAAIRAFATSGQLAEHRLHIAGDGPERPRLEAIVKETGASDRIIFEGRKTQAEVADLMRLCDVFVFPSIRELGAGVVIEAMASGMVCLVTDYGAPGVLADHDRGIRIPMGAREDLVRKYRSAMEDCVGKPGEMIPLALAGRHYAHSHFTWDIKASYTTRVYDAVVSGAPPPKIEAYL